MIFTEEWLRQYVNPALGTDELADALTMAGLEVEEVRTIAPAFSGVVVGEVLSCRDHENSDHLHVCEVNAGTGETLQIVCGAPNVRAGIKVACATIGAVLPGDFRIKKSKLRGVVSMGMLCSTRELGINEDHNGIWILPDDAPVGVDIRQYARLDDAKIELKLTPNRGDALSVVGVARDVHAITGAPLTLPAMDPVAATCSCTLPVDVQAPDLCGRFTSRILRGLNAAAPTPDWMKARLERCGMRSISALVDISNYVMLELGRPTHFYDLKKIPADRLTVRWAREGESVQLLNGETVALDPWYGASARAMSLSAWQASWAGSRPPSARKRRTSLLSLPSGSRKRFRAAAANLISRPMRPTAMNAASILLQRPNILNTSHGSCSTFAARPKRR